MTLPGRDVAEVEALVTDRYLDSLLAAADLPWIGLVPDAGQAGGPGGGRVGSQRDRGASRDPRSRLDAGVRLASSRLTRDLPRFHPSFRFEERLAVRLAEAAAAMRLPAAAGAEGSVAVVPIRQSGAAAPASLDPYGFDPLADPDPEPDAATSRPLLIGGAVAASAISLAGAAWVAWRRSRTASSPMARAVRAAHALRERPA